MAVIAVDAGTSIIKAVAFSEDGSELALSRVETPVLHPHPQYSEQSMDAVWTAVASTLAEVRRHLRESVTSICTTAQGDGCWLVDASGKPTGNALLWNDGRAVSIVEQWHDSEILKAAGRISGSMSYPGLSNALLAWLKQHDVERLGDSAWVLSCNGWIHSKLTGQFAADLSDASNPFADVRAGDYSEQLFELHGLAEHGRMFPEILRGASLSHPLAAHPAAQLGITEGTPVVMAPYDIVSTAYGAGVVAPGQACLILGTTICAETLVSRIDENAKGDGTTLTLDDGLFLRAMPTLSGCETLQWAATMLNVPDLTALSDLAQTAEPGSGGLFFLPYISEAGERAPFLDPMASGSWHGLKLTHRREHMARAVYEGLTFAIRECLEAAGGVTTEVRVCGGGSKSDFWCQMIADAAGVRVLRPVASELGARGAFLFGRVILGHFSSLAEADAALPIRSFAFHPHAGRSALYRQRYEAFLRIRESVQPTWHDTAPGEAR